MRAAGSRIILLLALLAIILVLAAPGASDRAPDLSGYPWLYLREGQPPSEDETVVSLLAVGDVMPGRGVRAEPRPLQAAAPWLQQADVTLGNLEVALESGTPASSRCLPAVKMTALQGPSEFGTPASSRCLPAVKMTALQGPSERIVLTAPVAVTPQLRSAGFDVLSLANNHSLDLGTEGLAATAAHLETAGITPLGAGHGDAAFAPHIRDIRGVRLAFLAFTAVPDPGADPAPGDWQPAQWDEARATAVVRAARRQAHAVIVYVHWGQEYALRAAPWQQEAAEALVQAGADLIIGHHPHVVQETAAVPQHGAFVAYSLGNFLFDQESPETRQGLALRAFFDEAGLVAVQALPLWAGLQPRLMSEVDAQPLLARISPPAPPLVLGCDESGCAPTRHAPQPADETESIFWSGVIDLTGDGTPELVRRASEQVTIYENGEPVWQSPADWRVVDVALGDPNDDGRGELLLALWQRDAEGHERSQPYIVGHRGGEYDVIWGGRPVSTPILEVALGDVDGDGAQELVVLEEVAGGARPAVWRWQGWNFSLFWRGEAGASEDLRLMRGDDGAWLVVLSHDNQAPR